MSYSLNSIGTAIHLFAYRMNEIFLPPDYYIFLRQIYWGSLSRLYAGNSVFCVCCDKPFQRFLTFKGMPEVLCPGCGTGYWHRAIWLYLKTRTNIFRDPLTVLHIAPEYIFQKSLSQLSNLNYLSVALNSRFAMAKMDITDISYEDNRFDAILCSHVLEHIPDEQAALRELFRVLKPGGWAILQSPINHEIDKTIEDLSITSPQDRERLFGQFDHVRMYGRDYPTRLERAGFTVKEDSVVGDLDTDQIRKHGLRTDEYIYFCTKQ